jgi:hypothetical protein
MSITSKIPYGFAAERTALSWGDVRYALERQLVAPDTAIQRATDALSDSAASPDELALASSTAADPVLDIVRRLTETKGYRPEDSEEKWLYILLAWLYENRDGFEDPLGLVEEVYAEFGYPRAIAPFVRYMPMVGPDLGSRERNELRLFSYWEKYLDDSNNRFRPSGGVGSRSHQS